MKKREEVYYGQKLEPAAGKILHGAGQSSHEFYNYYQALNTPPLIYMSYCGLRGDIEAFFDRLIAQLEQYPDRFLIPQIGLSMTKDGAPEEHYEHRVAAGAYDQQIEAFCKGLRRLGRPVFLRVGYEFNGHWNGYEAESYQLAWQRIATALWDHGLEEVALVWCYAPDDTESDVMSYYPGDEFVDWWSVDCLDAEHFTSRGTRTFVQEADQRGYPVMIGESTPRYVGVLDGLFCWNKWFIPYFRFMEKYPNVKAFCYISWDWVAYPQWKRWGNCRINDNPEVLELYQAELLKDRYLHASDEQTTREMLNL